MIKFLQGEENFYQHIYAQFNADLGTRKKQAKTIPIRRRINYLNKMISRWCHSCYGKSKCSIIYSCWRKNWQYSFLMLVSSINYSVLLSGQKQSISCSMHCSTLFLTSIFLSSFQSCLFFLSPLAHSVFSLRERILSVSVLIWATFVELIGHTIFCTVQYIRLAMSRDFSARFRV